jgi:hypothetical protein
MSAANPAGQDAPAKKNVNFAKKGLTEQVVWVNFFLSSIRPLLCSGPAASLPANSGVFSPNRSFLQQFSRRIKSRKPFAANDLRDNRSED